jgi:7-cyano-7-deazaguanine synthase in queuosine biosynthesis
MEVTVDVKTEEALENGMSVCEIRVPERDTRQYLFLPYDDLHRRFGAPEGVAGDLLVVAGGCYVIDKLIPRRLAADNWTRELEVTFPVEEPDLWKEVAFQLSDALSFLTGDIWSLTFHKREGSLYQGLHRRLHSVPFMPDATRVCLFSGGLDSLTGAINLLESGERIALVGHYGLGSNTRKVQSELAKELRAIYPKGFELFQARVGPVQTLSSGTGIYASVSMPDGSERTTRSRSLVFLALGLYVAQQQEDGTIPLIIPENGFIALNPPLTPSRLGSCSSRTVHPLFIDQIEAIARKLGFGHPIRNPFAGKTKGRVLSESANPGLLGRLASYTVSCAHPSRPWTWKRRAARNCGYCVPCIFRRAAMHRIGQDRGKGYGYDVCTGELPIAKRKAADLRAVLSWVHDVHMGQVTPERLVRRMTLPAGFRSTALEVMAAGMEEIAQFFQDKMESAGIRRWAGLE